MKKLLLVPALLFAACGDNLQPDEDQLATGAGGTEVPSDDPEARPLQAQIFIETITCVETIARFEAGAQYLDDGTNALNIACSWTFDDGSTSSECAGEHRFATAGAHDFVLEVTDLDTGATAVSTQTRVSAPPLELTLDVTSNGLSISYNASSNTGGDQIVFVLPEALVHIEDDQNYPRATSATLRVREPGTYTVRYDVEDERGSGEICQAQLLKEIEVVCDGAGHVH
jgi:hypothetical protein